MTVNSLATQTMNIGYVREHIYSAPHQPPHLFLFPVGPVLLLIELSLPTEHTGGHVVMREV